MDISGYVIKYKYTDLTDVFYKRVRDEAELSKFYDTCMAEQNELSKGERANARIVIESWAR